MKLCCVFFRCVLRFRNRGSKECAKVLLNLRLHSRGKKMLKNCIFPMLLTFSLWSSQSNEIEMCLRQTYRDASAIEEGIMASRGTEQAVYRYSTIDEESRASKDAWETQRTELFERLAKEREEQKSFMRGYDLLISLRAAIEWGSSEVVQTYNSIVNQWWRCACCLCWEREKNEPAICRELTFDTAMGAAQYIGSNRQVWGLLDVLKKVKGYVHAGLGSGQGFLELASVIEKHISCFLRGNRELEALITQQEAGEYPGDLVCAVASLPDQCELLRVFDVEAYGFVHTCLQRYKSLAMPVLQKISCIVP